MPVGGRGSSLRFVSEPRELDIQFVEDRLGVPTSLHGTPVPPYSHFHAMPDEGGADGDTRPHCGSDDAEGSGRSGRTTYLRNPAVADS